MGGDVRPGRDSRQQPPPGPPCGSPAGQLPHRAGTPMARDNRHMRSAGPRANHTGKSRSGGTSISSTAHISPTRMVRAGYCTSLCIALQAHQNTPTKIANIGGTLAQMTSSILSNTGRAPQWYGAERSVPLPGYTFDRLCHQAVTAQHRQQRIEQRLSSGAVPLPSATSVYAGYPPPAQTASLNWAISSSGSSDRRSKLSSRSSNR